MPIGPRIGARIGPRIGARVGSPVGTAYSLATVTRDATSLMYCPANSAEWAQVIGVAGLTGTVPVPDALWLCQEASGNLADSVGAFTLTASGTGLAYQQTVAGWSRKFVRTLDNTSGRWDSSSASLPDLASASCSMYSYCSRGGAGALARMCLGIGTTQAYVGGGTSPLRGVHGANALGGSAGAGVVRPHGIVSDRTNTRARAYDDQQKLSMSFGTVSGKRLTLGGLGGVINPGTDFTSYAWAWFTPPSDADLKTILQTLGWTIAWS